MPQKFRSGNAARKSVMNALMSSRPFRGSCSEYFSSMSGAAISSTMPRLQVLPQKSVNQRPTIGLVVVLQAHGSSFRLLRQRSPVGSDDLGAA